MFNPADVEIAQVTTRINAMRQQMAEEDRRRRIEKQKRDQEKMSNSLSEDEIREYAEAYQRVLRGPGNRSR